MSPIRRMDRIAVIKLTGFTRCSHNCGPASTCRHCWRPYTLPASWNLRLPAISEQRRADQTMWVARISASRPASKPTAVLRSLFGEARQVRVAGTREMPLAAAMMDGSGDDNGRLQLDS